MTTRGCGDRVEGGIYFECRPGIGGKPVEYFLFCPPVPVPEEWGLTPVGSRLILDNVVDWIGESHYPNVLDWIEEVRIFGISARMPSNFPFEQLTMESRFMPVHRRGLIGNYEEMRLYFPNGKREANCPSLTHGASEGPCAGLWWEDVQGGEESPRDKWRWSRPVERAMPSFKYVANRAPDGFVPRYTPAILGAFPLTRIVVVHGADSKEKLSRISSILSPKIPLVEVEE